MENHQRPAPPQQPQVPQRRPADVRIITRLNESLDARANELRQVQDRLTFQQALTDELTDECAGLHAALDQVTTENRLLRQRLDLPAVGAIELTDEESGAEPEPTDDVAGTAVEADRHDHPPFV